VSEMIDVSVPKPPEGRKVFAGECDAELAEQLRKRIAADPREAERINKRLEGFLRSIVEGRS
jgi:hypothetical protein